MLRAFLASNPSAEGIFYVAVKTTGVFCRPICHARKPSPHHIEFFGTEREAVHGGYRPCKRCRPMDMNYLAIVAPCHRMIRADGSLCGYGGGLWRKQWLLDHERRSRSSS